MWTKAKGPVVTHLKKRFAIKAQHIAGPGSRDPSLVRCHDRKALYSLNLGHGQALSTDFIKTSQLLLVWLWEAQLKIS